MTDELGDRMKGYECAARAYIVPRMPFIVRLDGKSFHTYTRHMSKPFDRLFMASMQATAEKLRKELEGCVLAYVQSDEITLLFQTARHYATQPLFSGRIEKICSVSASMATALFNRSIQDCLPDADSDFRSAVGGQLGLFDARAFSIPQSDALNNFLWRQKDAVRNSVNSVAQSVFSAKEMHGVKLADLKDKLRTEKGIDWDKDYTDDEKYGVFFLDSGDYNARFPSAPVEDRISAPVADNKDKFFSYVSFALREEV